jgi:hypothetical protein
MRLTARQLNRATLGRQLLLRRETLDAVEGVRRVVALQAQEPASVYIALWNRLAGFDPTDLDRAYAEHAVVKASLLRITLHAVTADDYPAFHQAMQFTLRAARLNDRRFAVAGLSKADADALLPAVLEFAVKPRSGAEMEAWLDDRLGVLPRPGVWWAMRTYAPLWHAPATGPWTFRPKAAYTAARTTAAADVDIAVQQLVRRYLAGFGPASVADIAQFSTIVRPPIHSAVEALGDELVRLEGPDGRELLDVPTGLLPAEGAAAPPRLMAMWDSVLFGHVGRERVVPAEYRGLVIRRNGDTLPTLLVDGYVAGVWRPLDGGIEATAFRPLSDDDWAGLETEAQGLLAFIGNRDAQVYRRYARWWADLPAAEVRLLGRGSA